MKKIRILSILIFLTMSPLFAQTNDSIVKVINKEYTEIRNGINSYDTTIVEVWDESTEGGQITTFYNKGNLKFIEAIWFGESGKHQLEYYFLDGKLIFAFDQYFVYNRPIYWDEKVAKEIGDNETFDPEKTIVKEDRYYFNNETLFLWIDDENKKPDLTLGTNTLIGQGLIANCYKMIDDIKKSK